MNYNKTRVTAPHQEDRNQVKRRLQVARKSANRLKQMRKQYADQPMPGMGAPEAKDREAIALQNTAKKRKRNKGVKACGWSKLMRSMRCHYCGEAGGTVDHVVPRGQGGETSPENCVPACAPCNHFRGDRPYGWFKKTGWLQRPRKRFA